jgi:NTP pyrophosphatase (non-canonical NTP hydrolase)
MQDLNLNVYQKLASRTAANQEMLENFIYSLLDIPTIINFTLENKHLSQEDFSGKLVHEILRQLAPHWATMIAALGLVGEAGEYAELIKKRYGHNHPVDPDKIKNELGDVQWYLAENARLNNYSLEEVGKSNLEKLLKRYPDKFSSSASQARIDVE